MSSLKEKTAKGLFWGGMNNMVQQIVGLAFGIVLGRLLSPYDYGMMAMISVFSLVATALQDSGFKVALTNQEKPTDADYNSVFWFNIIMGLAMYAMLFAAAPLIAHYYNTPKVVPLCRLAFLSIVIASLGTAQSAWLSRTSGPSSRLRRQWLLCSCRAAWERAWRLHEWPIGLWQRKAWSM